MGRRLALLPVLLALGCNGGLTVDSFIGSIAQLTIVGAAPTAAGSHLELWTRNQNADLIRVDASYTFPDPVDHTQTKTIYTLGLSIRPAVDRNDPCFIDGKGNLLTTPAAYQTTMLAGITETPQEQAQAYVNRIKQITSTTDCDATAPTDCGAQASTLLAVVPFDDTPPPQVMATDSASVRLAACQAYWAKSPLAYTGNPAQVTAPIHGTAYGFVYYQTNRPSAAYDGIRIDSPTNLAGAQDLWFSTETAPLAMVDGNNQGPIFLEGKADQGGNDVIHFDLTAPSAASTVTGTAALYTNLDNSSVEF
jgi:hypothetical protein